MSVPEVEEINISCEAGMEESFPGASAPKIIIDFYQKKFYNSES